MSKILIVTDNFIIYEKIKEIILTNEVYLDFTIDFRRSKLSTNKKLYTGQIEKLKEIDVQEECDYILANYSIVISAHCKQIFPAKLVKAIPCINIHPGYNPYNRGWYPQVFAILNKTKIGATIHYMDEYIDHGAIIARKEAFINSFDTSKEVYERVLDIEIELLEANLPLILKNKVSVIEPEIEGNYNSIQDYRKLCELNLNEKLTMGKAIDKLRALTHGSYKNAYFYDDSGKKIYVSIQLAQDIL